jgi:hypothetical protein
MWQSKMRSVGTVWLVAILACRATAPRPVLHKMSRRETGLVVLAVCSFPCQLGFGEIVSYMAACVLKLRVVGVHLYMK